MQESKANNQITIKGIVAPADWDDDGNIIAVIISTPLEEEYLVDAGDLGEELLGLIGTEVVVRGTAGSDRDGFKTIAVKHCGVLEEEIEDEDEEEYGDEGEFEEDTEVEDEEELERQEEQW